MTREYTAPQFEGDAFNCPYCDAYAHQLWWDTYAKSEKGTTNIPGLTVAICEKCGDYSLWLGDRMILPQESTAPMPSDDMPDDVKEDYLEARSIVVASPRGACGLLRLAVQTLMPHFGTKGKDLDDDIGQLVEQGLRVGIQKALDSLRVIGNDAVHPGVLDLKDDVETATALFDALNMIVEDMITRPKAIEELYSMLPETKKEHIRERDSTEPST